MTYVQQTGTKPNFTFFSFSSSPLTRQSLVPRRVQSERTKSLCLQRLVAWMHKWKMACEHNPLAKKTSKQLLIDVFEVRRQEQVILLVIAF